MKFDFKSKLNEDKFGLMVLGIDYAYISLKRNGDQLQLVFGKCINAEKGDRETEVELDSLTEKTN